MKDHRVVGLKKCICGRVDGCRCYDKPPTDGSSVHRPKNTLQIKVETNLDEVEAQLRRIEEMIDRIRDKSKWTVEVD